jgi:hypothetical protein
MERSRWVIRFSDENHGSLKAIEAATFSCKPIFFDATTEPFYNKKTTTRTYKN